jgi:hypothetical protein
MEYKKNENGELLLNIEDAIKEELGEGTFQGFSRYNGGWIKQITGLDKSVTDGYSILGEFAPKKKTWVKPGVYLDCSIAGSRKNQDRRFHLFILCTDGSIKQIGEEMEYSGSSGGDWAVDMWDDIENTLKNPNFTNPIEKSRLDVLKDEEKNLLEQLEKIRDEIKKLELEN